MAGNITWNEQGKGERDRKRERGREGCVTSWGDIIIYSPQVERSPTDQRKDPLHLGHLSRLLGLLTGSTPQGIPFSQLFTSYVMAVGISGRWHLRRVFCLRVPLSPWGNVNVPDILNVLSGLSQLLYRRTARVSSTLHGWGQSLSSWPSRHLKVPPLNIYIGGEPLGDSIQT